MNKIFVSLLLALGICGTSQAADTVVGDAAAGQAKTAVCSACHGPDGNSLVPNFPKLAGGASDIRLSNCMKSRTASASCWK